MNDIQKTALKETVKTLAGLTALALLVPAAIFLVPPDVLGGIASVVLLGFGAKMIYDIKLGQAKAEAEAKMKVDQ